MVPPATGVASALPERQLPGPSALLPEVELRDFTAAVPEAEDSREGPVEVVAALEALTEEAVGEDAGKLRWLEIQK